MGVISNLLGTRAKGIGMMSVVGAVPSYFTDKNAALEKGDSKAMATTKGLASAAGWIVAEPLMWGLSAASALKGVAEFGLETSREIKHDYDKISKQTYQDLDKNGQARGAHSGGRTAVLGGNFVDNEQAATLRQRQMSLLRQHRMATETILGSEARQLHR